VLSKIGNFSLVELPDLAEAPALALNFTGGVVLHPILEELYKARNLERFIF